jgi:hypothetical protein
VELLKGMIGSRLLISQGFPAHVGAFTEESIKHRNLGMQLRGITELPW